MFSVYAYIRIKEHTELDQQDARHSNATLCKILGAENCLASVIAKGTNADQAGRVSVDAL